MEGTEPTAQASSGNQPRAMAKSAFTLIKFLLYMKSSDEGRAIIIYTHGPEPCDKCGEEHLVINQFYYHYN